MRAVKTDHLTLEPQAAAHASEMFVVLSDPALYEYENKPPPSLEWLRVRFTKLESRLSPDGHEKWLNWVIRLPTSELIGYVQATIGPQGRAGIAYELSSAYWGRGLAFEAVRAMISELADNYGVQLIYAVLSQKSLRSMRLLERLRFSPASPEERAAHEIEQGELMMCRELGSFVSRADRP